MVHDLNKYVALSEEFANDTSEKVKSGGLLFDRRVTRIVSPGTLIDEQFMEPQDNNFLLSVLLPESEPVGVLGGSLEDRNPGLVAGKTPGLDSPVGLAWLDLSTGQFFTQQLLLSSLLSAISSIGPREVIVDEALKHSHDHGVLASLREEHLLITYHSFSALEPSLSAWNPMLERPVAAADETKFTREEIWAGTNLLDYVTSRLQGQTLKLQPPVRKQVAEHMFIDKNSMRSLEIKTTMKDGLSRGSLLHSIRRTSTKGGARLLSNWLCEYCWGRFF